MQTQKAARIVSACLMICIALVGCANQTSNSDQPQAKAAELKGELIPMAHARTFTVTQHEGYRVVELRASVISFTEGAKGPEQRARLVLLPHQTPAPVLNGDLAGATIIRVPVQRIAMNASPFEAMLRELRIQDRIVAVGGAKSWDDALRKRVLAGEIAQVGYGWHSPPQLDALLNAKSDLFLMSLGDISHAQHYERIRKLGVPVVPVFLESEMHYMGKVDYVRLLGMLTGREAEADAFVAKVAAEVSALKQQAAAQPPVPVISAWYAGGDRWQASVRNTEAQFLRDANGVNLLQEPDDVRLDSLASLSTEALLQRARTAECWIIRDSHSQPFDDHSTLKKFRAIERNCVFAVDGMVKPEADAFDFYETAVIRPDLVLGDIVRMLHPPLRNQPFRYVQPDKNLQ
jgi:iron complex transport system substrate-binding protein